MTVRLCLPLLLAVAQPGSAQMLRSGAGDPQVQLVEYQINQVVPVRTPADSPITIELATGERITSVSLGDTAAWDVTANKAGNHLYVKATQADRSANMTVVTGSRIYGFNLMATTADAGDLPHTLRFIYPVISVASEQEPGTRSSASPVVGEYRLRGDRSLYPAAISDDGTRTFIDWPAGGPLPAVYSRDQDGRETLMNGNMRGKLFVIDSVDRQLVFRVDKRQARADRLPVSAKP